tara:strand:- start:7216 stop:7509 length:294 start_codon:yes stop_codon:yes gene_type:complete
MNSTELLRSVAVDAQRKFERQITKVCVPITVPLSQVDISDCHIDVEWDRDIGWTYEVDLTGARFEGHEIDPDFLSDAARDTLIQRKIEEFNEGPEAA